MRVELRILELDLIKQADSINLVELKLKPRHKLAEHKLGYLYSI
jgi:hypothetical protein